MAPSNHDSDSERPADEEQNPFIVFRRYADEQMSSLLQSLIGLPSAFTPQSPNERWLPFDERETRRREKEMRSGAATSSDEAREVVGSRGAGVEAELRKYKNTHAWPEVREDSRDSRRQQDGHPQHDHPLFNPTFSDSSSLSVFGDDPFFQRGLFTRGLFPDTFAAAWPVGYLIFSPYSPLRLEQQERFRDYGSRWRDAFEDLIAVQAGQSLPERPPQETLGERDQGAGEWVAALLAQGFADGWQRINDGENAHMQRDHMTMAPDTRHPENDAREDAATELDLYERILALQETSSTGTAVSENGASRSPSSTTNLESQSSSRTTEGPSVISALTTTERKVLPDGSVHTKVVLKKRFADGREESSETVHTTHGAAQQLPQPSASPRGRNIDSKTTGGDEQGNKKKGWFWSD
ncbi:hypothetical protein MMC16_006567 [Acarospora aff. strigata]|nr:hypothetical protein [Acarospora aff. strigata]